MSVERDVLDRIERLGIRHFVCRSVVRVAAELGWEYLERYAAILGASARDWIPGVERGMSRITRAGPAYTPARGRLAGRL